ncbi:diaminopimelate decarboxylase [Streptomyces sp. NPDC000963]|uniref:diaminopimelate decarboxylase n=1 Tax=Streptomyces sp. NPDC088752 TaxID=3154963 RepID=UPI001393EB28|nr:diaminopimelate decarboxylase [Streptomyces sp. SID2131]
MTTSKNSVQGHSMADLAEEYGTPLFVYDADVLADTYRTLRGLLPGAADIFYSLKANPNVSVCALLNSFGAGAEVSSHAELATALRAGVDPGDIIFLGPGKDERELTACVEAGIHAIVCESLDELELLDSLLAAAGRDGFPVLLRVNPAFGSKGSGLAMGGKPRQFGIDEAELRGSGHRLAALRNIRVKGVHAYMGTRFLDHEDVVENTRRILATAEDLSEQLGFPLETVDFGGGLGVAYFDNEEDLDLDALGAGLTEVITPFSARHPGCRMIMELGRFLTATAGTYVVRARYVKESMGESFVVADGGTNHHMAAVGVGSFVKRNFPVRHLEDRAGGAPRPYSVTGPLCTPNDVVAKKVPLPEVRPGDLLAVERSGAYGPTASPGLFLSHGFPAEVLVRDGRAHLIRERDTTEDLLAKQHLVDLRSTSA